jgi:hypothetical protein
MIETLLLFLLLCSACAGVLAAHSLAPIAFPLPPRLSANLAGMEGFFHGSTDATTNGIIGVAQTQTVDLLVVGCFEI